MADLLDRNRLQFLVRKPAEELDALVDLRCDPNERISLLLVSAFNECRVGRTPVSDDRLAKPHRTCLVGSVTDGDDEIKSDAGRVELVPRFAACSLRVDT